MAEGGQSLGRAERGGTVHPCALHHLVRICGTSTKISVSVWGGRAFLFPHIVPLILVTLLCPQASGQVAYMWEPGTPALPSGLLPIPGSWVPGVDLSAPDSMAVMISPHAYSLCRGDLHHLLTTCPQTSCLTSLSIT